ncbi:hypothetical protein [Streptomyces sp. NPDC048442]|uniref:hypothetical protein n=1 Tax=Streptomyces sp. NPDC048442 TaxID=3154823 RepID=UPI00343FB999
MQNISDKPSGSGGAGREVLLLAAGAALAVAAAGAFLAFTDMSSPLRAPFTVVFMVVAPGAAVAMWLRALDPLGRTVASAAAALALNLLVAQAMLAMHLWSFRGGIAAVAGISALLFLLTLVRRRGGRTARRQAS